MLRDGGQLESQGKLEEVNAGTEHEERQPWADYGKMDREGLERVCPPLTGSGRRLGGQAYPVWGNPSPDWPVDPLLYPRGLKSCCCS